MDYEEIRQRIINKAVKYAIEFESSKYKALASVAAEIHAFSKYNGLRVLFKTNYRERFFDYVLGNEEALTADEIRVISIYLANFRTNHVYNESVFEQFHKAVEMHRTEIKRLTESTEKIRRDQKSFFPFEVLPRIEDYVNYFREVIDEPDNGIMMYTSLYHIGFIDGKREERARRKGKTAPVGDEETA